MTESSYESFYHLLFSGSKLGMMIIDYKGQFLDVNPFFCQLVDYDKADLLKLRLDDLMSPEELQLDPPNIQLIDSGETIVKERLICKRNGESIPVEFHIQKLEYNKILVLIHDILVRVKAMQASEEKLKTLINSSPDIICFKDAEGRWMQANESILNLYGLNGVDYRDKTEFELSDYTAPIFQEAFKNCQGSDDLAWNSGTPSRTMEMIPDVHGNVHFFDVVKVPLFNPDGSRKGIVVFGRDMTEIKQAEKALRESELKYRQIAENTSDVIWMMDDKMRYTYVSPSIFKQRGFTPEEFMALSINEIYPPESLAKVIDIFQSAMEWSRKEKIPHDYSITVEMKHRCHDGSLRDSEVLISPVFDADGNLFGGHGVSRDITDRMRSEKALKESEDKFRGFFENAPIGIWVEDFSAVKLIIDEWKANNIDIRQYLGNHPDEVKNLASLVRIIDLNQTSIDMLGETSKESFKENLATYLNEESFVSFKEEMIILAEGSTSFSSEIPMMTPSGLRFLNLILAIQPGHEENWERVLVSFVDITQRRMAEEKIWLLTDFQSRLLKVSGLQDIHNLVVNTVHDLLGSGIVVTTNVDYQTANSRIIAHAGLSLSEEILVEMIGSNPFVQDYNLNEISQEDLELFRSGKFEKLPGGLYQLLVGKYPESKTKHIEKLLKIDSIYTVGFVYHDIHLGGLIILALSDLHPFAGTIEMIVSQAAISMNRIKAEIKLKEVEERFRQAFQTSPDSININHLDTGMYIEVNEGFYATTGYTRDEVIGKTSAEINIWGNIDDRSRMIEQLKADGKVKNFEAAFRLKDGSLRTCLMSAAIIQLNGVPHIISITRDIEEIKQAEMDLLQAKEAAEEASRLKTAFLNNISHEVRTPMNAILGFTDLLQTEDFEPHEKDRYFAIVQSNANQLLSIIDDVLEVSRMDSGRIPVTPVQFSLHDLMDEIHLSMKNVVAGKGLHFWYSVDDIGTTDFVVADMEKIRQVITGLIGNAVKFTASGSISFGCFIKDKELVFYVRDTGIGIAPEDQKRVFERFYQVSLEPTTGMHGTGLGLSIAHGLAEVMNGSIRVESTLGVGSVFILTIPYREPHFPKETNSPLTPFSLDVMTILVAEDEDFNYELLEILLGKQTRQLMRACNGTEVLDILQKKKPDLVLMDLKMPVMDGFEATRRAKKLFPDLHIIALTAYTQPEDERRAIEAGCSAFISKPIRKQELLEIIRRIVRT